MASEAAWLEVRKAALSGGIIMVSDLQACSLALLCTQTLHPNSGVIQEVLCFCVSTWMIALPALWRGNNLGYC